MFPLWLIARKNKLGETSEVKVELRKNLGMRDTREMENKVDIESGRDEKAMWQNIDEQKEVHLNYNSYIGTYLS